MFFGPWVRTTVLRGLTGSRTEVLSQTYRFWTIEFDTKSKNGKFHLALRLSTDRLNLPHRWVGRRGGWVLVRTGGLEACPTRFPTHLSDSGEEGKRGLYL